LSTAATQQEVSVDLKGSKLESKGTVVTLTSPNLTDENSFAAPKKISPTESEYKFKGTKALLSLAPYSVTVLKLKMK
jgi:alpha-N-arabinofuranosidase